MTWRRRPSPGSSTAPMRRASPPTAGVRTRTMSEREPARVEDLRRDDEVGGSASTLHHFVP